MVNADPRPRRLWTGRWMKAADGSAVPVIVDVPQGRHVNNGRSLERYLAKGFRPVSEIPAAGPDEPLRLAAGELPEVEPFLAAMDPPEATRETLSLEGEGRERVSPDCGPALTRPCGPTSPGGRGVAAPHAGDGGNEGRAAPCCSPKA